MKRRKIGKSRSKRIYGFNSTKSEQHFRVESSLEFDACYHLEFHANISLFQAQPLGYEYKSFGKTAKYTPDFKAIDSHSGQESRLEVKSDKEAESRKFQEIFEHKKAAAEELNTPLDLLTESEIRKEPLLGNLKILYKYRTKSPMDHRHFDIIDLIGAQGPIQIKVLPQMIGLEKKHCYPLIYDLLARGVLIPTSPLEETALNSLSFVRVQS
ncbi:TnsA endonuclease N-terminal domain-containing protein [Kistimonas scapharcae]|uniref:TnsA endonuclease N-terminal domain-containing protein n=1 Tax=Kistimonas scapharcae TaxID=1036133 RepID=A0ABP8V6W4_9GAMM